MLNGCIDQVWRCRQSVASDPYSIRTTSVCVEAANMCKNRFPHCSSSSLSFFLTSYQRPLTDTIIQQIGRDNVEGPFYLYSDRSMYDIRRMSYEQPYPDFFIRWLNLPETQRALGVQVSFMYEESSHDVYSAFQQSGDYVYPGFKEDLEFLLAVGIRIL
jgi:carboxypeptidase D